MQDLKHNVKWQVSLSNGETFFEGKGNYQEIAGEKSPWQRLLCYIANNKLKITSISLYTDFGQTFNLPSSGNNPKFGAFLDAEKPIDYNMFRSLAREARVINMKADKAKVSDWFTTIEAIYPSKIVEANGEIKVTKKDGTTKIIPQKINIKIPGYKLQLWVDENNTKNCWVLVVNI